MFFFMNTDFWRAMPPPPSLHHNDNKNNNKKNILIIALFKTRMFFCEKSKGIKNYMRIDYSNLD